MVSTSRSPGQSRPLPAPPTLLARPSPLAPLPTPLTPLVGREREVALAVALLRRADVRLLTITGPGGIGKTRLALEIGRGEAATFADGVVFVPLAAVSDAELVAATIARALDLQVVAGVAVLDALAAALRDAAALLVLDNFEHVLDAAPLLSDLLARCPRLKILATSRSLLRLGGEQALPVPPLVLPDPQADPSLEKVAESAAVRLFVDRARAVVPSFALTAATATLVADICRHLDGLPLAIELAAAQSVVLPPAALLGRIQAQLPLPVTGPRDAPVRLRSMRDAIAWSYDLLAPEAQALFRRLAVFNGGFTLEAAESVSSPSSPSVLEGIAGLVEASLLRPELEADGPARYRMLETIREFAAERLTESGEAAAIRRAHAAYFLDLAERLHPAPFLPADRDALDRLDAEHANMRAALTWLEASGRTADSTRLAGALGWSWFVRGDLPDLLVWLERVVERTDAASAPVRIQTAVVLSLAMLAQGNLERAGALAADALALARTTSDRLGAAQSLGMLGVWATAGGEYDQSVAYLQESVAVARSLDDQRQAVGMASSALANLGVALRGLGRIAEAAAHHEEALAGQRAVGSVRGEMNSLGDLADIALERGDLATAVERCHAALRLAWTLGEKRAIAGMVEGLACAAAASGRAEPAARLFGASARLRELTGFGDWLPLNRAACERGIGAVRAALGEEPFAAAWAAGRALPLEEAVVAALNLDVAPLAAPRGPLTPRETEVLRLLVAGLPDRAIAAALFLSVRTVEAHVASLLAKLGVRSRTAAVSAAIATGLVEPDAPESALLTNNVPRRRPPLETAPPAASGEAASRA